MVDQNSEDALVWQIRKSDAEPHKLTILFSVAAIVGILGILYSKNIVIGLICFILILVTTGDFWLPVKYRIDNKQITRKCGVSLSSLDWENVKRVIRSKDGVKLSPLAEEGRMSPFRGVFLEFKENEEAVLAEIKKYWEGEIATLG